jgi:cyclopropane fatty-acyl-phospholipid synthase-like methyltransferase
MARPSPWCLTAPFDFVFSFDSLVHVESDVIENYLTQLAKKLKPNGIGFIHHSCPWSPP